MPITSLTGHTNLLIDPAVSMLRKEQLGRHGSQMSDDEPLYDSVASDDDYAALASDNTIGLSATIASDHEVSTAILSPV